MAHNVSKQVLRKDMKKTLLQLTKEEKKSQSLRVTQKLLGDDHYKSAKSIAMYLR